MQQFKTKYTKELLSRISDQKDLIADGVPKNFEDYQKEIGYLRGLQRSLEVFEDFYMEYLRTENLDEF